MEQEVQTETQAARIARELEASVAAKARAEKDLAKKRAHDADAWITSQLANMSDPALGAVILSNLAAVVGLSAWLGYKAWGLYEKGRLGWKSVGLGLGVLGVVGAFEGVFAT